VTGIQDLFPDGQPVDKSRLRQGLVGPVLNLQGFGAIADGQTDVADAFERALAVAAEPSILYLPAGRYALRRPVKLERTGLHLVMTGAVIDATGLGGPTIDGVHYHYPTTPLFHVTGRDITLTGGHLVGAPKVDVSVGVLLHGAKQCRVHGMRISGAFYASIWPGGGSEDILIDTCVIENASQNVVLGFISREGPQLTRIIVRDVISTGSGENGLLAHGHVHDLQILGGFYRNNTKDGIDLFTCAETVTIQGVHCIDNRVKGLDFKYSPDWTGPPGQGAGIVGKVTISGCHLSRNGHAGCCVSISSTDDYPEIGISHFLVQGNQAHRNGDHGFYFVLREGVVANNIARENGDRGFNFLSCQDVAVSGNEAIDNCQGHTDSTEGFGFQFESNGTRAPPNRRLAIAGNIARRNRPVGNQLQGFALHAARIESSTFTGNISSGHHQNIAVAGELRNVVIVGNIGD